VQAKLNELELDALTELINLGISNSALSLRAMVQEEVVLSVPLVMELSKEEAIAKLDAHDSKPHIAVQQDFQGDITGRALLIFPVVNSLELVRILAPKDLTLHELLNLEHEAFAETGNVLLNGCLSTIANTLQRTLAISLPEVLYGRGIELFEPTASADGDDRVLFSYINFSLKLRSVEGFIAMVLDTSSMVALKELIAAYIERTTGER
jgi:chemotaxis protein CheC